MVVDVVVTVMTVQKLVTVLRKQPVRVDLGTRSAVNAAATLFGPAFLLAKAKQSSRRRELLGPSWCGLICRRLVHHHVQNQIEQDWPTKPLPPVGTEYKHAQHGIYFLQLSILLCKRNCEDSILLRGIR